MNLAELVRRHGADARALYGDDRWHTWGDVRHRAAALAAGLRALGVGADDRVAIAWPTSVDFVVAYLGVLAAGAVAVPLNPNSPADELRRELEAVEPLVLLAGGGAAGGAVTAAAEVSGLRLVAPAGAAAGAGVPIWEELSGLGAPGPTPFEPVERGEGDLAVLLFTSGTAGDPRAAMLTHGNLLANLHQMQAVPDILRADDVGLVALPLFHVFGLNVAVGLGAATGASLVLDSRFDAEASLRQVHELGVTTLLGVPAMFAAWADASGPAKNGASPLAGVRRAISGASALDPAVAARFEARHGIALWQGYGLTEASPAVSTSFGTGRNRPGSVGPPLPGVEVRLVDEEGEPVLEGDPGEIWVRGPNVFAGYWRDAEATARVLTAEGWLRTGDIGVVGEDGDIFVVDRSKDLVIVSGFNVFPGEVERVLGALAGVAECVVIGRPDDTTGERVEAVVVLDPGAEVSAEQVRSHCAARLARYKCPASVRFVPELPHGLTGKALRRALRDQPPA